MTIDEFKKLATEIADGARREPAPDCVEVSPPAAALLTALNRAHRRGDTATIERIREEAFALMFP